MPSEASSEVSETSYVDGEAYDAALLEEPVLTRVCSAAEASKLLVGGASAPSDTTATSALPPQPCARLRDKLLPAWLMWRTSTQGSRYTCAGPSPSSATPVRAAAHRTEALR